MKTRLSLKRLAFSHFTQLVNHWDPNIRLHDDVIDGRFHSNTEIGLAFTGGIEPRFFGKVTTAAASMTYRRLRPQRRNKNVFQGGVETRTERVTLPRDMPDVVERRRRRRPARVRRRHAHHLQPRRQLRVARGQWRRAAASAPSLRDQPRYLIGDKGAKLYVRGTVAGIFTVYSPTDIEIEDDLVYVKDPRDTVISRDFLALISGRDIKRRAARRSPAPATCNIHAALFARRALLHRVGRSTARPARSYILGSLTAGTILETEPRYATKLDYDKRFEYLRPASFPDDPPLRGRFLGSGLGRGRKATTAPQRNRARALGIAFSRRRRFRAIFVPWGAFRVHCAPPVRMGHPGTPRISPPTMTPNNTICHPPSFAELGLSAAVVAALNDVGYETPTPIQAQTIPVLLGGADLLGPGADRHRQDGGVRAAHPLEDRPRAARAAGAGARAHARARDPGRRGLPEIRREDARLPRAAHLRRPELHAAAQGPQARRARHRRHARAA